MTAKFHHPLLPLVLAGLLVLEGCDVAEPPVALSKKAIATRDAPAEHVFRGELGGNSVHLLLHDCEVYSVKPKDTAKIKGEVEWESVLALEPYPFGSSCVRQSIEYQAGNLTVSLGSMAFGAGGCCIRSGTYRSADGRNWKKISDSIN